MRKERTGHVRGIVDGILQKLEGGTVKKANAVITAWAGSIDERAKGHARPVSFKKGVLLVAVENSTWLYKLTLDKEKIKNKFNKIYTGRSKIDKIRFRIGDINI